MVPGGLRPSHPSSIAALPAGQADVPVYVGDLYAKQMEKEFVQVGTLVYRREGPAAALRFPEDLRTREDWEFVGRLARLGPAAYLDYESEVVHRHAEGQLTNLDDFLLVKARMKLLQRVWARTNLPAHPRRALPPAVDELRVQRVKDLIGDGSHDEAREELGRVQRPPMMLRVLGALPAPLPSALVRGRRRGPPVARRSAAVPGEWALSPSPSWWP